MEEEDEPAPVVAGFEDEDEAAAAASMGAGDPPADEDPMAIEVVPELSTVVVADVASPWSGSVALRLLCGGGSEDEVGMALAE